MNTTPFLRRGLPVVVAVATLVFGVAATGNAEDVDAPTFYDEVVTEVVESYPEPSPAQSEVVAPVAAGALVGQPPPTTWDRVAVSPCMDPEPSCAPLP